MLPEAVQEAEVTGAEHWQEELQHAPVQGLVGEQELVGPWYISPPAQPLMATPTQAQLVMLQQTPGQGVEQVPLQVNVPPEQLPVATTVHTPVVVLQQRPMQGVGVQEVEPQ